MALFKRRNREPGELPQPEAIEPSWARLLGLIGSGLDNVPHELRDIVIVTEGQADEHGAMISLLGYRDSAYHVGWTSMMYSLRLSPNDPGAIHQLPIPGAPPAFPRTREQRFCAIGDLLDRSGTQLRAVTVVDLDAGALVNAVVPVMDPVPGWELRSIVLANDRIANTARQIRNAQLSIAPR
jgi:hypothetical protein